jgi:diacylglycerol kinase family enzyme
MHVYIYDHFINSKSSLQSLIAKLETRITDLGLNGKICRVGPSQSVAQVISAEVGQGTKTIVVVGNDATVAQAIDAMADTRIPLGIIPIGKNNALAKALGINDETQACDILSSRRIEELSLGLAGEKHFLACAEIGSENTIIETSKDYSIQINGKGVVSVINFPS